MNLRKTIILPRFWAAALALTGLGPLAAAEGGPAAEAPPAFEVWAVMGTEASVSMPQAQRSKIPAAAAVTRKVFQDLDTSLSVYKPDSEISRLNAHAGKGAFAVSPSTLEVLRISLRYAELSGGAFDPTVLPLCRLWGFSGGPKPAAPPSGQALGEVLRRTGHRRLVLSEGKALLDLPGMGIDLGGIAKGYAVDVAFDRLPAKEYPDVLVNLGGNLRCRGTGRGGGPWVVGVRNPFAPDGIVGVLSLSGGLAVATSGNYERFVTIGGERLTHILDPRTGRPVTGMAGVTVVCPTAVETDALSTSLFVLGPVASRPLLKRCPAARALFIPDHEPLEILVTPGLESVFRPEPGFEGKVKVLEDR